jgi:hypothetical protein
MATPTAPTAGPTVSMATSAASIAGPIDAMPPAPNNSMWIGLGVVLLIILVVGGGIWFTTRSSTTVFQPAQTHDAPAAHHAPAHTHLITLHLVSPQKKAPPNPPVTSIGQLNGNWRIVYKTVFKGVTRHDTEIHCITNGRVRDRFEAALSLHNGVLHQGKARSRGPVTHNGFTMVHTILGIHKETTYNRLSHSCPPPSGTYSGF